MPVQRFSNNCLSGCSTEMLLGRSSENLHINTIPATRSMLEAAVLDIHQSTEIWVLDERGGASNACVRLLRGPVLRCRHDAHSIFLLEPNFSK